MKIQKLKTNINRHNGRLAWQTKSALTHQAPAKDGQVQDIKRETIQLIEKTGLEKQNAGLTHVTNLFPYSPISLFPCKRCAFTLAEVLITLAVIGIVAVLTLPNLIQNHNQKAWDTAANVFNKRLEVAARVMNTQETLAGYSNTKAFVNELKKHIKITRICDNNELTKCFPEKIFWGAEQEEIDVDKDIKSAKNMGQDNWGTEVIGAQFANGVEALIAYDPNCTQDPFNNQIQASNCMAILYDVSAKKNPNSYGKDLRANGKVLSLAGNGCAFEVAGTCYTNPVIPDPLPYDECMEIGSSLGIKSCNDYSSIPEDELENAGLPPGFTFADYWGGAVKHCGGVQNLPNWQQLAELASEVYGEKIYSIGEGGPTGLTMNTSNPIVSLLFSSYNSNEGFLIFTNDTHYVQFNLDSVYYPDLLNREVAALAICIAK